MLGLVPRCSVSKKCVELYNTYKGKELALKLAEYTVDHWLHLYEPKVFKDKLPGVIVKYRMLRTEKERDAFNKDNPDWINREEMKAYADAKRGLEIQNTGNRYYLEETLRTLEKDTVRSYKVRGLLSRY